MKIYEYDIAVSLCKQDMDFAKRLVSFLNPGLRVFFYVDQQEQLITQCGPETFAKIFKEKSRMVVILSRDEWSQSFYTDIERNAIVDRTAIKNEGYNFLFVIPMEPSQIPSWYPSTRIYADPRAFPVDQLAKFIEFKVTELGGLVKPVTLEDRHEQFLKKIENKKRLVSLQEDKEAISVGRKEIGLLANIFNQKIENLKNISWSGLSYIPFSGLQTKASVRISKYELRCAISEFVLHEISTKTTQDILVEFGIYQRTTIENKLIREWIGVFVYDVKKYGWATPIYYNDINQTHFEWQLLFRARNDLRYDLSSPQTSNELVDSWFQELFELSTGGLNKFL